MDIISRKEAQEQGFKRYFTEELCKRGHVCERQTSDRACVECKKRYWKNNKDKIKAKRRAAEKDAIPSWYDTEKDIIDLIYQTREELSKINETMYHVDHIVPLQHSLVCGLHCYANLQIIKGSDNSSKGNRFKV